ncbi:unnamed protein product, partial [Adineta steineri]
SNGTEVDSSPKKTVPDNKPLQQSTNPFDSNLTDDDIRGQTIDENENRLSIPLSLFIPRSAHRDSIKILEEGSNNQKQLDDSHSDINAAFGPRRSISSSPYSDHQLLSSLIEIKNDLSAEVRVLTRRMTHIDEQISQIFNILSPLHSSVVSNPEPAISNITQSSSPQPLLSRISSQSSPIRPSVLLLTTT